MPVGGIVVCLVSDQAQAQAAMDYLAEQPDLELGSVCKSSAPDGSSGSQSLRLPAVLESESSSSAEDRIREFQRHPGVYLIDVVYVGFTETDQIPANPMENPRRRTALDRQGCQNQNPKP